MQDGKHGNFTYIWFSLGNDHSIFFFPSHTIFFFFFFFYLCRIVRAHLTQVKGEYIIQREKRPPAHPRIHMPLLLHLVTIGPSVLLLDIWKCGTFGSHQTEEISLHKSQASPFLSGRASVSWHLVAKRRLSKWVKRRNDTQTMI